MSPSYQREGESLLFNPQGLPLWLGEPQWDDGSFFSSFFFNGSQPFLSYVPPVKYVLTSAKHFGLWKNYFQRLFLMDAHFKYI